MKYLLINYITHCFVNWCCAIFSYPYFLMNFCCISMEAWDMFLSLRSHTTLSHKLYLVLEVTQLGCTLFLEARYDATVFEMSDGKYTTIYCTLLQLPNHEKAHGLLAHSDELCKVIFNIINNYRRNTYVLLEEEDIFFWWRFTSRTTGPKHNNYIFRKQGDKPSSNI
jgi:hypothetical protein